MALPLLGATGASAASEAVWDRVAECESGGAWSADTGNGYYGGLQLSRKDWVKYGGLEYAPTPDQASRSQQIAVGEKILAAEGGGAWPTCGHASGLLGDSGPVDADTGGADGSPGSTGSSASSGSSTSSDSPFGVVEESGKADAGPVESREGSKDSDGTADSGAIGVKRDDSGNSERGDGSADDADASPGTGRHRAGGAAEGATGTHADGVGGSAGRHASRDGDSARDAVAADGPYTVRAGDNLWAIADSLDLQGGWPELYAENRETVGSDPNLILPGQRLDVRDEPGEK
jgi:hypothetical protein